MAPTSMASDSEWTGANTPTASSAYDFMDERRVALPVDPKTIAGQKIGAILAIKRKPATAAIQSEVDDLVRVLGHDGRTCKIFNLRLENTEHVPWSSFFALAVGSKCGCSDADCRCVMGNPMDFVTHRLQVEMARDTMQTDSQPSAPATVPVATSPQHADPYTIEGQQPDAILTIKHVALQYNQSYGLKPYEFQVGDFVKVISHESSEVVKVISLRTQTEFKMYWVSVFPVGEHDICACKCKNPSGHCSCVYVDFKKSTGRSA